MPHGEPMRGPLKVGEKVAGDEGPVSYRSEVGGIIAGYSGFRPRSRDHFGESTFGKVPHFQGPKTWRQESTARGSASQQDFGLSAGYERFAPESGKYGNSDTCQKAVTERSFRTVEARGVLPGYKGHVPRARDEVRQPTRLGAGPEPLARLHLSPPPPPSPSLRPSSTPPTHLPPHPSSSFSSHARGVATCRSAFGPLARSRAQRGPRSQFGGSTFGGIPKEAVSQSPNGHANLGGGILGGKERFGGVTSSMTDDRPEYKDVNGRGVMPGYGGHVPAARDKFGGSTCGGYPKRSARSRSPAARGAASARQ